MTPSSCLAQAQAQVGPRPPGDPGLMLENAGRLLSLVAELESQASAMSRTAPTGSGPYITAAIAASIAESSCLLQAAGRLQDAERLMRRGAQDVREAQHAWELQVSRLAARLEHEARCARPADPYGV